MKIEFESKMPPEMHNKLEHLLSYLEKQPRNWQIEFITRLCGQMQIGVVKWLDDTFEGTDYIFEGGLNASLEN